MDMVLPELAETVAEAEDLETLTRPMLIMLEQLTGMESTYLTHIDELAGIQRILYSRNVRQMQIPEGLEVPWGDTLCKRALEEGRPYTDDVAGCWGDSDAAKALGIKTYLSTPVRHGGGELYGTLCAASDRPVPLKPEILKTLEMFSNLIAAQVDRERMVAKLRRDNAELTSRALTDPLTGVANRRALGEELARRLARREDNTVLVGFIDLDGFKTINDKHGHDAGDRFLKQISTRLAANIRAGEFMARFGGDEFIVLGESGEPGRLRSRIEQLTVGIFDLGSTVIDYGGASVGVTVANADETVDALLKRADAAMYDIKKSRRVLRT